MSLDAGALTDLLAEGRNRNDLNNDVIENLGFSVGLWNQAPAAVGLSATVGLYAKTPGLPNNFVLELPAPNETTAQFYRPDAGVKIIQAIIEAWQPDWATWCSPALWDSRIPPLEPEIGWLTYLRDVELDTEFSDVSRRISGGVLLQVAPTFADTTPEAVSDLRERLSKVSVLHPAP